MHQSHQPTDAAPLPPRYDAALAAGAIIGSCGLVTFIATQLDPGLRVSSDAQFDIVLWCLTIAIPSGTCWLLRPHIRHLAYAMRLGRAMRMLPDAPPVNPRRSIGARRWLWGSCGTIGACLWTLAAAIDLGAATGYLEIHGALLGIASLMLCQIGQACEVVRVMGPSLASVDDVYRVAHDFGALATSVPSDVVTPIRRSGA